MLHLPSGLTWTIAALAGFLLRGAAIFWNLGIPLYTGGKQEGG
jgi:hypothetical protein